MGGGTSSAGDTVTLELPASLFAELEKAGRRRRQSVTRYLAGLLQDQADIKEAEKRWKDIESGKVKTIPAAQVYRELGLK